MQEGKKRIYVDQDDVLCDWLGAWRKALADNPAQGFPQAGMDFFRKLEPLPWAVTGIKTLAEEGHDVWILTRPAYMNPLCYTEKRLWVEDHLGLEWCERLILCPDKSLLKGDLLIDDTNWPGFEGKQIFFGKRNAQDIQIGWHWLLRKTEDGRRTIDLILEGTLTDSTLIRQAK